MSGWDRAAAKAASSLRRNAARFEGRKTRPRPAMAPLPTRKKPA